MNPENVNQRKKMRLKFALLYFASLVLMGVVFASLWAGRNDDFRKSDVISHEQLLQEHQLYQLDEMMHSHFSVLQKEEQDYVLLLADSGMIKNGKIFTDTLKMLDNHINEGLANLSMLLDSIEKKKETFSFPATKKGIENTISFFSNELHYHRLNSNLRQLVNSGNFAPSDLQIMTKWQTELQHKDEKIRMLGDELAKALHDKNSNQPVPVKPIAELENLKLSLTNDESQNANMVKVNKALKEDNDRLLAEITKYNRLLENSDRVKMEKQADMEKKVKELTDELYLSHVDCNLSRADAKQIVYNSRQRKDLLAEALSVLKNLSQSGNAGVQQKVKEKTAQLQNIANTVRD